MRLGVLGPAGGDVAALGRAAEFLLNTVRVHRAIYVGSDDAIDRAVAAWARKLVGEDPSADGTWTRASNLALEGTPEEIDRFVAGERARLRLRALEALPSSANVAIERIGNRVVVLVHDATGLAERDVSNASVVVFGKSDAPAIRRVGERWFITPGSIGARGGGLAVLDDEQPDVCVTIFDGTGRATRRESLGSHADGLAVER